MSVGILIITHDGIGPALLGTTSHMLGGCPLNSRLLMASRDSDPQELEHQAEEFVEALDTGDGVLVLTDLYGSTPSNIATKMMKKSFIRVVSGVNLSMLVRVFNYPSLSLEELAEKAVSGGQDGIISMPEE